MRPAASESSALDQTLLQILNELQLPLSARQIASRVRRLGFNFSEYQAIEALRKLHKDGSVVIDGGKWLSNRSTKTVNEVKCLRYSSPPNIPPLSDEVAQILDWSPSQENLSPPNNYDIGDNHWNFFRKLLDYYRQCIRNEEGAEAFAYQNQLGEKFFYLRRLGRWYPRPNTAWQCIIPIGAYLTGLINNLPGPTDEDTLVIGYPVFAFCKVRDQEPDISFIRPVFYFPVEYSIGREGLVLRNTEPAFTVNLNWLEYTFKNSPEKRRSFLSACGLINTSYITTDTSSMAQNMAKPSLEVMLTALKSFMPQKIKEPLNINTIPDDLLPEPFESGIYNRAAVMIARKSRYSATLLKELAAIRRASDADLEVTALGYIFKSSKNIPSSEEIVHEKKVVDTTQLNTEQRYAVGNLLENPLTIVTGPPGTGKSQVIASTGINIRLQNQTMLFASRNHKAIDAVDYRLVDSMGRSLMVRTNSKDDPNLKFTFISAVRQLLNEQYDEEAIERFNLLWAEISQLLEKRGLFARKASEITKISTTLGRIEEKMSYSGRKLPSGMSDFLQMKPSVFPLKTINRIVQISKKLTGKTTAKSVGDKAFFWFTCLSILPFYFQASRRLHFIPSSPLLPQWPTPSTLGSAFNDLMLLDRAGEFVKSRFEALAIERNLKDLPDLEEIIDEIANLTTRISNFAIQQIDQDLESRSGLPPDADRQEMAELINKLRATYANVRTGRVENRHMAGIHYVLRAFPCWSVTNLSAGSRLPLIPAIFDLLVIDEASQSDIPSAIPLLFRAKRVGVVGDPHQLRFCSNVSISKDAMLRRGVDIQDCTEARFFYAENSVYDLCVATRGAETIFLSETYRSVAEIAEYSNVTFYNCKLRVATDTASLNVPKETRAGINWTDTKGIIKSAGGSGCYCSEEIDEVETVVRSLQGNNFRGTLGIVTPFRQQANRIRDLLFESENVLYQFLLAAKCHVDTAHGFQGDERDVIIFSLCGGPDMPRGSLNFLRESTNLFNVAASRARAVLHIIGNREWAENSGISHIEKLSKRENTRCVGISKRGPWYPHESPWEKILYDALVAKGLEPRPQFPVTGRRLDMALIKNSASGLKLDIEVDGDCHRNSDGTRKVDDVWRDIQLQGMGWKVMRFWTYQLREDLQGCVQKIYTAWSET